MRGGGNEWVTHTQRHRDTERHDRQRAVRRRRRGEGRGLVARRKEADPGAEDEVEGEAHGPKLSLFHYDTPTQAAVPPNKGRLIISFCLSISSCSRSFIYVSFLCLFR